MAVTVDLERLNGQGRQAAALAIFPVDGNFAVDGVPKTIRSSVVAAAAAAAAAEDMSESKILERDMSDVGRDLGTVDDEADMGSEVVDMG
jgi:hypothetical protein